MHSVDTYPYDLNTIVISNHPDPTNSDGSTSAPKMVVVNFDSWLAEVQKETDPFTALCKKCHKVADDVWTTQFSDESGALIDCKLCHWTWDSTAFGTVRPGTFRYIELFENGSKKPLAYIRISHDHLDGEWLWINRGDNVTGSQSKALAEKISRAMRIQNCFLADSSKTTMKVGGEMQIRVPLQVMRGYGYYGPTFTLVQTTSTKSKVRIDETNRTLFYKQNPKKQQQDLAWLQNLKISDILKTIVKDNKESVKWLTDAKKFYFGHQDVTLQQFIKVLYEKKEARADYECAYLTLLVTTELKRNTPEQKRYYNVIKALHHNMLMFSSFC